MIGLKGRVFDVEGIMENGVVLIDGGKIIKVGKDLDTSGVNTIEGGFITHGLADAKPISSD